MARRARALTTKLYKAAQLENASLTESKRDEVREQIVTTLCEYCAAQRRGLTPVTIVAIQPVTTVRLANRPVVNGNGNGEIHRFYFPKKQGMRGYAKSRRPRHNKIRIDS